MAILIKNGTVVDEQGWRRVDVLCRNERIACVGTNIETSPDTEIFDARHMYVFPGFIDPHVHIYLPFRGTRTSDTYETAGPAALVGGTTCFLDFVNPGRHEDPLACLEIWHEQSMGRCACDFGFHMAVTRFDKRTPDVLREIVRLGIPSFKVYLAYKSSLAMEDAELFDALRLARDMGVLTVAHCENAALIDALQRQLLRQGRTGPEAHYWSRPPLVEADGVHHLLTMAALTGAHVYIAHVSCRQALERIALIAHQPTWVETCPHYLLLDRMRIERAYGFQGAKFVVSPPLRDKQDQYALWHGLRDGSVHTLATDHAPTNFQSQKTMGCDQFTHIPNGLPTLEHRAALLYTYGVETGRINLDRFVDALSVQPAKIFGLYPRKGAVAVGSDADLAVFDPRPESVISADMQMMNVDYTPYEGWAVKGRMALVAVRGEPAVRDGEFVGDPKRGRFIARQPTHG